ncbi:MAG TPA: XTP/dITP diphosphatase [Syntrophales bacterium]|nr:XTP/dITP diphosphatase [Syntrophales bacterium]
MKIVVATKNQGKLRELQALLEGTDLELCSLADYPAMAEVVEDGTTFLENALKKAKAVAAFTGETAVADDSGLEVAALGGRPGIHSARYAGEKAGDRENVMKLLRELEEVPPARRDAAFRCVLVLCRPGSAFEAFEGSWEGKITMIPRGENGFGYDPVFLVPEYGKTAAEIPPELKNRLSHRAKALQKLKKKLAGDREIG